MQAVEDFAEALMTLASNRALCSAMGAAGRRRISEHFNWNDKGLTMTKVYTAVTEARESNDSVRHAEDRERLYLY
jgi:glycosyltransferase involved in cell wall biosynthesis